MKIYKLVEDANNYQWIMPENRDDITERLSFECQSKISGWSPVKMFVFNPAKKKGNFFTLGGIGALVFDEKVLDKMLTIFEMAGEILPLKVNDMTLYALNVLSCVNSIDKDKSTWNYYDDGTRGRLIKYSFHTDRITESSIFKIPETCKGEILTSYGINDKEDEFLTLYKKHGFTGLTFEELFSE